MDTITLQTLTDAAAIALAISVIVAALTELTKQLLTSTKEAKLLPVLPLVYGVAIAFLAANQYSWRADVLGGLMCGLGAMRLYIGGKALVGK
jgi:hypothetical protein